MAVKLDIELNWITNLNTIEKEVLSMNKRVANLTKSFDKNYLLLSDTQRLQSNISALKQYDNIVESLFQKYDKMNKKGELAGFLDLYGWRTRSNQKRLSPSQLTQFVSMRANEEKDHIAAINEIHEKALKENVEFDKKQQNTQDWIDYANELQDKWSYERENKEFDDMMSSFVDGFMSASHENSERVKNAQKEQERAAIQERRNQEEEARQREGERAWEIKMNKLHEKALKENQKRDDDLRKKQLWALFGRWGKLGIWGFVAQQAIKYISKAANFVYSESQQGLDWQRTISGGASGGSWFGKGLAAYQRAGIGGANYQNFKRGIQGYLGSVKLGMGNAAPLMYLGLSALGNPDMLEKELERSLRRLPKDVSLALAGQMGLDYNMWEAIYSGRIDREKSFYSEEAIRQWSELGKSLNDLITNINVFFFNYFAPLAGAIGEFVDSLNKGKTGIGDVLGKSTYPLLELPKKLTFGAIEIVLKNEQGEVVQTVEAQPEVQIDQAAQEFVI